MLILEGTFKGQVFERKKVSAQMLIQEFGLQAMLDVNKKVVFNLPKKASKTMKGSSPHPVKFGILTTFSAVKDGNTFKLTYADREIIGNANGKMVAKYNPPKYYFENGTSIVDQDKDIDLIVFLMLHPNNTLSPLYRKGSEQMFSTYNPDTEANKSYDLLTQQAEIYEQITKGDLEELSIRAKGLGIRINPRQNQGRNLRSALFQSYQKALEAKRFKEWKGKFGAATTFFDGLVEDMIAYRIIEQSVNQRTGKAVWSFGLTAGSDAGTKICEIPKDQKPKDALKVYLNTNIDYYQKLFASKKDAFDKNKKLQAAISGRQKDPVDAIVSAAISNDIVYLDRSVNKAFFIGSKGEPNKTAIVEANSFNELKEKFTEKVKNDAAFREEISEKITAKA